MMLTKADIRAALAKTGRPTSDFDLNADTSQRPPAKVQAGVLMGISPSPSGPQVLLTKRAKHLAAHPGQVAFPGGKMDPEDADITTTALREAEEETGLPRSMVQVLGQMQPHDTVTGFRVTPVVGWIEGTWDIKLDPEEVEEAFFVPLTHLSDPRTYSVQSRVWMCAPRYYYTTPYGPYYIWGATARILRAFADGFQ